MPSGKYTRYTVVSSCTLQQNYNFLMLLFWKQKSAIGSYTSKKVLVSRGNPCFSAFLFLDEAFCLKLTRTVCHRIPFRHYTTLLFASWRGLCVVKGVESSVCIRFVNYNTGVILSQSTGAWQVFDYEVHWQHVRSIVGPSLLERCLVNENCLWGNPPREDIKGLSFLTTIQQ